MTSDNAPPIDSNSDNCVLHTHIGAQSHHFAGIGGLSIKSFRGGRVHYKAGTGQFAVELLCVFFHPGLMADVFRSVNGLPTAAAGRFGGADGAAKILALSGILP